MVQETFLRAYRQLGRFEARASFGTWIHRIAVNCAMDLLRQRPRHQTAAPLEDARPRVCGGHPGRGRRPGRIGWRRARRFGRRLNRALDGLTPAERTAFMLRHFEGRSLEEIGRALGLRTSATKHSIFRAVQKMRRALEPLVTS